MRLTWTGRVSGTHLAATLASISAHPSHDRAVVCVKVLSVYAAALTWYTLRLEGALRFAALSWIERIGTFRIPNH